jgi:hypothetical protein
MPNSVASCRRNNWIPKGNLYEDVGAARKKMLDDRWMIREMEIETLNSGHRTSLFVESAEKP